MYILEESHVKSFLDFIKYGILTINKLFYLNMESMPEILLFYPT